MLYGIILGLSMILGAVASKLGVPHGFWWGMLTGSIVDLVLLFLKGYGPAIRKHWKFWKSSESATGTETTKKWEFKSVKWFWSNKWSLIWTIASIYLLVILIISLGGLPTPQSLTRTWNNLIYKKTLVFQKNNLKDYKLCGVQPGQRSFRVNNGNHISVFLQVDDVTEKSDITSFVLVNNTIAGETFEVGKSGCVTVSFSNPDWVREHASFPPQRFALTFE